MSEVGEESCRSVKKHGMSLRPQSHPDTKGNVLQNTLFIGVHGKKVHPSVGEGHDAPYERRTWNNQSGNETVFHRFHSRLFPFAASGSAPHAEYRPQRPQGTLHRRSYGGEDFSTLLPIEVQGSKTMFLHRRSDLVKEPLESAPL